MPLRHPKAIKQAINLIILNGVLTGSQLLQEISNDGITLPKTVIDEILSLEPDTIVEDDIDSSSKIISFAQLRANNSKETL